MVRRILRALAAFEGHHNCCNYHHHHPSRVKPW